MQLQLQLQMFDIGQHTLSLYIPQIEVVQQQYVQQKQMDTKASIPYWAQVWPAALGLGSFLWQHAHFIKGKIVLELAAGLGLPSLVAARFATTVTCTDYVKEAVHAATLSAQHNNLQNLQCSVLDWHYIPSELNADVLLLSDVNYEPAEFEVLYKILARFIEKNTTIILSTPQRLMAKSFIERLLPWCIQQQTEIVQHHGKVAVTILVLKGGSSFF
jgi:predicted nicotinamide N-methyase